MKLAHTTLVVAALTSVSTVPALATDGNLYYGGPQPSWATGTQATVTIPATNVWQISLPKLAVALTGVKWAMAWGCPVGGSEIAYVKWSALRHDPPSAFAQEVVSEYGTEYSLPDVWLPVSPNLATDYAFPMPAGRCSATLQLRQGDQVAQHARTYWIGNPHVYYRDLTAPSVAIRNVPLQWLNAADTTIPVTWGVADNWGSDGVTTQTVSFGGLTKWSGVPGVGEHGATIDLAGVLDGHPVLRIDVDGDGTAPGATAQTLSVDRTAPTASAPTATLTATPAGASFSWTTGDATSGVAGSQIEINDAPNGAVTGQWVATGPVLSGGGAKSAADVLVSGVPDGVHATRVRVRDNAGNVAYSAHGEVVVDKTAPTITLGAIPVTPVRALTLTATLDDNLAVRLGLGVTRIQANAAPDGTTSGVWVNLHEPAVLGAGAHRLPLDLAALSDGRHLVRFTTENGGPAGPRLVGTTTFTLDVDQTSPTVTDVAFRRVGPERVDVGWIARDARSGVASARLDWFDGATWKALMTVPATNGIGALALDTTLLPGGDHPVRVVVGDAAGNETFTQTQSIAVDRIPPGVTGLRVTGGPPWSVTWVGTDMLGAPCQTKVFVNGPQTALQWAEVATAPGGNGERSVVLPLEGFAAGAYRVRVTACDAAGNTTSVETAGILIGAQTQTAAAGAASRAGSRLTDATLTVAVAGAKTTQRDGGARYTLRVGYGTRVRITGRLTDAAGRPIAGEGVSARTAKGVIVASARTGADGRYAVTVLAEQSGVLSMGVAVDQSFLPEFPTADVRVLVLPRVNLNASSRTAVALGAPIVFTGRLTPSPRARDLRGKAIVLEFRDPVRRAWRPVVNARVRANGTFRIAWRFQARGQRIPMRVRVPAELGWNLEGQVSAPITITIR